MSTRTRFRPDRQLTTRMLITMFLLGLLYVAFAAAIFALLRSVVWLVIIAAILLIAQFWFSDRIALWGMRGQIVTPEQAPQLHGMVDRLCASANMPKPQVAISAMDMPNAFATGRSQKHAVLCVTNGMLRRLEPRELEAVLAHELSHVAHRDVAVITIASFIGVLAGLLARMAFYSELFGGGRRNNNDQSAFLVMAIVMLVSMVVYAISFLLIRALSRYRELAADRAAAFLTGHPSDLASALTKVTGQIGRIPTQDLRTAQAFNAFFFAPARGRGASLANLLSTHPTLERRLEQLAKISTQLGQPIS